MKPLCLICNKNLAIKNPQYGYLPCANPCGNGKSRKTLTYEFMPESVKQSRKEYWKDIIQSSRDGVLSKERLEAYGTKGIKVSQEQIDNAQYIWDDAESKGNSYRQGTPKNI